MIFDSRYNKTLAARVLGISRNRLYKKLEAWVLIHRKG